MTKKSGILAILLVLALMCALFSACGGNGGGESKPISSGAVESDGNENSAQSGESVSREESLSPEELYNVYMGSDYEGRTFTVFTSDVDEEALSDIVYNTEAIGGETLPDRMNNALLNRQNTLRQKLGVELREIYHYDASRLGGSALNKVREAIETGSNEFQAINISLYDCGTLSLEGSLYNLYDVPDFEPSNPWWDQTFNNSVEMFGKLYFTHGDIDFRTKNAITCILYNRTLCKKLGLEDPVQLTIDYKWTLDKCIEIAKNLSNDHDGDGIDYLDDIGWAGQYDDMYYMMYGSGVRILTPDGRGYPQLSFYDGKTENVVTKVLGFMADTDHYISGNDLWNKTPWKWPMEALLDGFAKGRYIFFAGVVEHVFMLKDMNDELAIVPSPMYDDNQHQYFSLLNTWGANAFAVPINVAEGGELQFVGRVLDTLGYLSWKEYPDSLAFNYYDVVLKSQKLTNEESEKMIDIIFNSAGCETGAIYQVGGAGKTVYDMIANELMASKRTEGLAAVYETNKNRFEDSVQEIIDTFNDLD